jgi:hypothetical protein
MHEADVRSRLIQGVFTVDGPPEETSSSSLVASNGSCLIVIAVIYEVKLVSASTLWSYRATHRIGMKS